MDPLSPITSPPNPKRPITTADSEDTAREDKHEDSEPNIIVVDWDGPDDPTNPKNWKYSKKWASTVIVSLFTFISPVSSAMVAPATSQIVEEFGVHSSVVQAMMTSVFVLGYAFGPLFLGPMSEIWGRSHVLQLSNLFYLVWNLACGFAQNKEQLIAFRLLAGIGGSAPLSIGGGVLSDVWRVEQRGRASAIYSLAPLLGPVIGPICGGWIAMRSTWRWVFWSTSIIDVIVQLAGLYYLNESFAPFLLGKKAKTLRASLLERNERAKEVRTVYETKGSRQWKHIFRVALTRPFALFAFEPIIQLFGIYMALIYGVFYLFLTTIPQIFSSTYHQNVGIGGLHYIALGIGLSGASQLNARYMDRIYIWLRGRYGNGVGRPEFRLPSMLPGTIAMPLGLLLTGWAAQNKLHWIVTDIGIAFVGMGVILNFQAMQIYILDSFTLHAASALAAVSCLRSLAGFGFPLFAPSMYDTLGYGKGNTILACVAIVIGCPAPFVFWIYGEKIRHTSRFARKPESQPRAQSSKETSAQSSDPDVEKAIVPSDGPDPEKTSTHSS
ncbi:hypothetical protein Agabi119p4_10778 [Agaricus bisporus var. burnettii]|uniref:Major facilitator superfamily (MFS) profile domain-containing protein n=1 Tax=Agaricus bisporus var. burnettii TaxID=192524 RepID=A0A8H7C0C4_AGABI|nr:hypothetical protein Agabi119p4_10778 [Agaricus bisporus var. burnettii]